MSNNVVDILEGVVGELRKMANSETVIGNPVTVGNKTVIPVVKISFGFGAGGGQGDLDEKQSGFGGGGGGGAKIEPFAFIIMDEDGVRLLPAGKGKWDTIIEAIPGIAKKISKFTEGFKKSDNGESEETDSDTVENEEASSDDNSSDTD